MSDAKNFKFSLKVMMNKQKTKVLFAEADSDFADVLLSFLTLPLGRIVKVLKKHYGEDQAPTIGSLTTLYNSLANLKSSYFWTEGGKQMLMNPRSSFEDECRKLKIDVGGTEPTKYFRCSNRDCKKRSPNVCMYYDTMTCDCGNSLSKPMGMMTNDVEGGVFTEKQVSFLVTDDLQMAPIVPGSIIQTLINLGITVTDGAELTIVTLGFNEIMDLLKQSLLSKSPLTDLILRKTHTLKCATRDLLQQIKKGSSSNSKKIIVKATVQKSTNKLLFCQTEEDFVDFLFSLLTIPLGGVEYLLGSNTSLRNIDNLYTSIMKFVDVKYLRTPDIKERLIKPELPPKYLSKNHIFPLTEQVTPTIYYFENTTITDTVTGSPKISVEKGFWMSFKDPKGEESYVKQPGKFAVTDDLFVKPLSNKLKIPSSDVEEMELQIGFEEALRILNASLTCSNSVLTNALINPLLEKQANEEN